MQSGRITRHASAVGLLISFAVFGVQQDGARLDPLRPEFHRLIEPDANIERAATGFRFTEGPLWSPRGFLLFSDIHGDRIYTWSPNTEVRIFRDPGQNPNGLTYDEKGRLLICEQKLRRLARLEKDNSLTVLADNWNGKRLNCPNDVVVRNDGNIYFTDPYWMFPPGSLQELSFQGVFRIAPDGRLHLEADNFDLPNGIALSPAEKTLYVSDSRRRTLYAFDVAPDGSLSRQRPLATLQSPQKGAVDGMKVDELGNIYTTGPGGVWVIDPTGRHLGTIRAPEIPANCAWGDHDYRTLYLAAPTSIYRVRMRVRGKPTGKLTFTQGVHHVKTID